MSYGSGATGLGFPWASVIAAGTQIIDSVGGGGGGGLNWRGFPLVDCGLPAQDVQAVLEAAPREASATFVRALQAANSGWIMPSLDEILSDQHAAAVAGAAIMGGQDCKVSSSEGQRLLQVWRDMEAGAASYPYTGDSDDYGGNVWEELGQRGMDKLREILGTATKEAAAAIYEAMSPEQRAEIREEILRREGGALAKASAGPLALAAIGGALVFLVTRKAR